MDRTNHPTAPGGHFNDPDPGTGAPGTTIDAAHMNAVQDELIALIEGAGLAPDRTNLAQLLEAVQRLAGTTGGLRNQIINGTFRIWQRADDFRGANGVRDEPLYTADRWEVQSDDPDGAGDGNVTRIRDQQAPGVAPGVFDALRYEVVTAPATGAVTIRAKLETLRELAGRRLTLGFLAGAGAMMAGLGASVGVLSRGWDQFSAISGLIILPLGFFSAVFFPIDALPPLAADLMRYAPLHLAVDGTRTAMIGVGDVPPAIGLPALWAWAVAAWAGAWFVVRRARPLRD